MRAAWATMQTKLGVFPPSAAQRSQSRSSGSVAAESIIEGSLWRLRRLRTHAISAASATVRTKAKLLPTSEAQHVTCLFLGASWVQLEGLFVS